MAARRLHRGSAQHLAQALRHDEIFACSHHPDTDNNGVLSCRQPGARRAAAGGRIQFDSRLALTQFHHDLTPGNLDVLEIIGDQQMRNLVGDRGNEDLGLQGWKCLEVVR